MQNPLEIEQEMHIFLSVSDEESKLILDSLQLLSEISNDTGEVEEREIFRRLMVDIDKQIKTSKQTAEANKQSQCHKVW